MADSQFTIAVDSLMTSSRCQAECQDCTRLTRLTRKLLTHWDTLDAGKPLQNGLVGGVGFPPLTIGLHVRVPGVYNTGSVRSVARGGFVRMTGPSTLRPNRVRRGVLVLGGSFLDRCALIGTCTNQGRVVKAGGAARRDDFEEHRAPRVSTVWFEVLGVAFATAGKD